MHPTFLYPQLAVLDFLSPSEKAHLILDPNSGALNDAHIVTEVLTSLTETSDYEQLKLFFGAFANINKQVNAHCKPYLSVNINKC